MLISRKSKGQVISYAIVNEKDGMSQETVNYLAYNLKNKNGYQYFTVNNLGEFKIKLWGRHNVQNALAVIASSLELKVPLGKLKKYLASFSGTARRAQVLGVYKGATIIDDYAHHPTEIKATLQGLKERYKQKKIRVVFHPHTFTRTKALFSDFVRSFSDIDELVVLDIYGSAREKKGGVSSFKLVKAIEKENRKHNVNQEVKNIKDIKLVVKYLKKTIQKDEVIVLMGAGDVFRVADNLLK
jgi:UDP-N-acetylmuramate--alanine ligase